MTPGAFVLQAVATYHAELDRVLPGRAQRVVLFGSWARGEAHEESDVDVLVILSGPLGSGDRATAIDTGAYVGIATHLPIAPLVLGEHEWAEMVARERRLTREIERDGIAA